MDKLGKQTLIAISNAKSAAAIATDSDDPVHLQRLEVAKVEALAALLEEVWEIRKKLTETPNA